MKDYPINDELAAIFDKSAAAMAIRDICVRLPFGYKRALRAARDEIYFERLFWKNVRELYRKDLYDKRLEYDQRKQVVREYPKE